MILSRAKDQNLVLHCQDDKVNLMVTKKTEEGLNFLALVKVKIIIIPAKVREIMVPMKDGQGI